MNELIFNKEENVISVDIRNNNALILTSYSNDEENYSFRLMLYNLRKNRLISDKSLNDEKYFLYEYEAEFVDDESIALYNVWEHTADTYDYELKPLEADIKYNQTKPLETVDYYDEKAKDNPLIDSGFVNYETFATDTLGNSRILVFYDDNETFYTQKCDDNEAIYTTLDKKIFTYYEKRDTITFQIKDYSSSTIVNSAEIALDVLTDEDMSRVAWIGGVSEKYIVAPIISNNGSLESIYYWDYTIGQTEEQFDAGAMKYNKIDDYINKAREDIENRYSINFKINPDTIDEDKPLVKEDNKIKIYLSLLYLDETFSQFPDGMIKEMYDYENGFDSMCIYLCNYIDDDFSNAYAANMNGENYIVYSTRSLTKSTIAHELMHAAEYRIWSVCGDKYDNQWEKLNPPDFYYVGYDEYSNYDDNEDVDKYFARDYGRAGNLEDKAVTFEYLFCYGINDMEIYWDKKSPVFKKGKLICEALRESYPSVSKSDNPVWEKYINE